MTIYHVEGGFVMSEGGVWRTGFFDTEATAILATELPDEVLQRLQESKNPGGIITTADVAGLLTG